MPTARELMELREIATRIAIQEGFAPITAGYDMRVRQHVQEAVSKATVMSAPDIAGLTRRIAKVEEMLGMAP